MASPTRRPAGRRRILLTFSDQAVSSASNFVTGVAVARLAGVARFGDYMLTIMVWLIVVGVHRAVITEPIIVTGGQGGGDRRATLAHGLTAELLLAAAASAVVATSGLGISLLGADLGRTMLALAPWFAPLLVQASSSMTSPSPACRSPRSSSSRSTGGGRSVSCWRHGASAPPPARCSDCSGSQWSEGSTPASACCAGCGP